MKVKIEDIHFKPLEKTPENTEKVESIMDSLNKLKRMLHRPTACMKGDEVYLIAGRKRVTAAKKLQWEELEVDIVEDSLSDDDKAEIRLHENLARTNLPWYEIASQEKELHELRQKQLGKSREKGGRGKSGWSMRDTAKELNVSLGRVSEDISLANAVLADKSLKKISDRATALRVVKSAVKRADQEQMAGLPPDIEIDQIYLGDSSTILPHFPENTFDAVITDPPWLEYKDESLTKDDSTIKVFKELYRVMKPNSFLYAIVGMNDFYVYREELPKFGFTVQKIPLIWVKVNVLSHGARSWEYARDYEPILLAVKGSPALTRATQFSSVMSHAVIPPVKLIHPHEKPIALIEQILDHCTFGGSTILDPFAGSGVVLSAAKKLGRKWVGIERNKEFYDRIVRRLA